MELSNAIKSNDVAKVQSLIGEDVNKFFVIPPSNQEFTALMIAAGNGSTEIAKLLIEKGADVDVQSENGDTALILAAQDGETEIAQLLIDAGAKLDLEDAEGNTALIHAVLDDNAEMVKLLLDKDADFDVEDAEGNTALIHASIEGYTEIAELLVEKGANLNAVDEDGNTALMWACGQGHMDIIELLIEKGADLDIKNEDGNTAYDLAKTYEIRDLLRPAAAVPVKEPKELEYTDEPMCFDMLENADISVLQALTSGKTIFKIGNVYNSTDTRILFEQLEKNENLRYKCKQESAQLRTLRPEDVDMDKTYYLLTLAGNYMVDMNDLTTSLDAGYRVFELEESGEEVEFTASRDVLYDDATGKSLSGQELDYVGADHCQKGTNRKPYALQPIRFVKKKAGGKRKTYRKKPSKRRNTYRK